MERGSRGSVDRYALTTYRLQIVCEVRTADQVRAQRSADAADNVRRLLLASRALPPPRTCTGELCSCTHFSLAETLVPVGSASQN